MIGQFDETNVIDAWLPKCLKNGQNPVSFNTGLFPGYIGPAGTTRTCTLTNTESGYGYDATSGSLKFDGVNDRCTLSAHVVSGKAFSFSFWAMFSKVSSMIYGELLSASSAKCIAYLASDQKLTFALRDSVPTVRTVVSNNVIALNESLHCVCVYDAVNLKQSVYVNGVLAGETTVENLAINASSYGSPILGNYDLVARPHACCIDNAIFFNTAITPERISTLYALGPDLGGLRMYSDGRLVAPNRRYRSIHTGVSVSV